MPRINNTLTQTQALNNVRDSRLNSTPSNSARNQAAQARASAVAARNAATARTNQGRTRKPPTVSDVRQMNNQFQSNQGRTPTAAQQSQQQAAVQQHQQHAAVQQHQQARGANRSLASHSPSQAALQRTLGGGDISNQAAGRSNVNPRATVTRGRNPF